MKSAGWLAREERQARIWAMATLHGRVRMADLRREMPSCNAETLRLDCAAMCEAGLLAPVGEGRGRVYVLRDALESGLS